MTKIFIVGAAVLLFVGLVGGAVIYLFGEQLGISDQLPQPSPPAEREITSFEDCVAAGNAVMESYPRQCRTADGKHFVEDIGNELEDRLQGDCIVTGCSGHICAAEEVFTTCEFLPEYACYQNAICERQTNGECGWTQTAELAQCLVDSKQASPDILPQ